jgi:hypothetical protein
MKAQMRQDAIHFNNSIQQKEVDSKNQTIQYIEDPHTLAMQAQQMIRGSRIYLVLGVHLLSAQFLTKSSNLCSSVMVLHPKQILLISNMVSQKPISD